MSTGLSIPPMSGPQQKLLLTEAVNELLGISRNPARRALRYSELVATGLIASDERGTLRSGKAIEDVKTKILGVEGSLEAFTRSYEGLTDTISNINNELFLQSEKTTALRSAFELRQKVLDGQIRAITASADAVQQLTTRVTANERSVSVLARSQTRLRSALTMGEGTLAFLGNEVEANATAVQTLETRVTATETDITAQASAITDLQASIAILPQVYVQDTMPPGTNYTVGDMWIESDNNNKVYVWDGTIWGDTASVSGTATYAQTTAPSGALNIGDIWFDTDNNNRMHRWNGSSWVDITNPVIDATANANQLLTTRVTAAEGNISTNANQITTLQSTVNHPTTGVVATATATQSLSTRVTTAEGKITNVEAKYVLKLDVNNRVLGFELINNGATGIFDILADRMKITKPAGVKSIEFADGTISSTTATHARYIGVDFGTASQFIDWYGPHPGTPASASDAAGLFYIKNDGSAYFGGKLSSAKVSATIRPTVLNPSFEYGIESWTDSLALGGSRYVEGGGSDGGNRLVLTIATGQNVGVINDQQIPVQHNQVIRVSGKCFGVGGANGRLAIHCWWYTSAGAYLGGFPTHKDGMPAVTAQNGWTEHINYVTAPPGAAFARVGITATGMTSGFWLVDQIEAGPETEANGGINLLPDSDFSRGGVGSGGYSGFGSDINGKYGYVGALGEGQYAFPFSETENVVIEGGQKYSAQAEVWVENPSTSAQFSAQLRFFDGAYNQMVDDASSLVYELAQIGNQQWYHLRIDGAVAPAGCARIRIILFLRGQATSMRFRKLKVEKSPVCTPYTNSADVAWGTELTVPGTNRRLGDQRNVPQSLATAYGSVRNTTSLSADSAGNVTVNAHTVRYGGVSIGYNYTPNAITGLNQNVRYVIYCLDPNYAGGSRTWFAAANPDTVMQQGDGVVVAGEITIPASGSSDGGGGGDGGGGPGDEWCVDADMVLPGGKRARDIMQDDLINCWNEKQDPGEVFLLAESNGIAVRPTWRIVSESGAEVWASATTPMPKRGAGSADLRVPDMLGEDVIVRDDDGIRWERVVICEPVGDREVCFIRVRQHCYFAGMESGRTIATHNPQYKP